jgi:hypothetical protein
VIYTVNRVGFAGREAPANDAPRRLREERG